MSYVPSYFSLYVWVFISSRNTVEYRSLINFFANPVHQTSRVGFVIRSIQIFFYLGNKKNQRLPLCQLSFGFRRMKLFVEILPHHQ